MKLNSLIVVVILVLMALFSRHSYGQNENKGSYGCRCEGSDIVFYISKDLASTAIGEGITPLLGAEVEGWTNDYSMSASGGEWIARIKGNNCKSGRKEAWGFWARENGPWGPGVLKRKGLIPSKDLIDNGFNTFNFNTTCR